MRGDCWRIQLFGNLRATNGEEAVSRFRSRKAETLLAFLALEIGKRHSREHLADLLWPECDYEAGLHNLSRELSSLRKTLGTSDAKGLIEEGGSERSEPVILADRSSVWLNPERTTTDVQEFEATLRAAASAGEIEERKRHLIRAMDVYQGHLLASRSDAWVLSTRERLASDYSKAVLQLVHLLTEAGSTEDALQVAQRAVTLNPLEEEIHREIIRLNLLSDRPSAARRQYQTLQRLLREELDAEPSPTTLALFDHVVPALSPTRPDPSQEGWSSHPDAEDLPPPGSETGDEGLSFVTVVTTTDQDGDLVDHRVVPAVKDEEAETIERPTPASPSLPTKTRWAASIGVVCVLVLGGIGAYLYQTLLNAPSPTTRVPPPTAVISTGRVGGSPPVPVNAPSPFPTERSDFLPKAGNEDIRSTSPKSPTSYEHPNPSAPKKERRNSTALRKEIPFTRDVSLPGFASLPMLPLLERSPELSPTTRKGTQKFARIKPSDNREKRVTNPPLPTNLSPGRVKATQIQGLEEELSPPAVRSHSKGSSVDPSDFHFIVFDGFGAELTGEGLKARQGPDQVNHIRKIEGRTAILPDGRKVPGFFLTVDLSKAWTIRHLKPETDDLHDLTEPRQGYTIEVYAVRDKGFKNLDRCAIFPWGEGLHKKRFKADFAERIQGYFITVRFKEDQRELFVFPKRVSYWEPSQHAWADLIFNEPEAKNCEVRFDVHE